MTKGMTTILWLAATVLWIGSASATKPTAAQKCQAGKNDAVASYAKCLQHAQSKFIINNDSNKLNTNLGNCATEFLAKWDKLEHKATVAGGACPTTQDKAFMVGFVARQSQLVSDALHVGSNLFSVGADMSHTDLVGADISNFNLTGVNLTGTHFAFVNATGTNFTNANLTQTIWPSTDLTGANLTNADMTGATLDGIHAINLSGCPANLPAGYACIDSALVGPQVSLASANLSGANLSGVDVSGALFANANLNNADFTGATLNNVVWSQTTCPDGSVSNTNGSSPESCCAHLNGHAPTSCSP